jgi:hypothetical protein
MNAELDATLEPILKHYADQQGVILSGSDGDQPGVIQYDLDKDVALLRQCDKVKAFSVYDVYSFRFMDDQRNMLRGFYTMPFQLKNV